MLYRREDGEAHRQCLIKSRRSQVTKAHHDVIKWIDIYFSSSKIKSWSSSSKQVQRSSWNPRQPHWVLRAPPPSACQRPLNTFSACHQSTWSSQACSSHVLCLPSHYKRAEEEDSQAISDHHRFPPLLWLMAVLVVNPVIVQDSASS